MDGKFDEAKSIIDRLKKDGVNSEFIQQLKDMEDGWRTGRITKESYNYCPEVKA